MGFAVVSRAFVASFFTFALGAILSISVSGTACAAGTSASPWIEASNSKARLVSGTVELDGKPTLVAGVQLRMSPEWKTYWKNPGDSGVPPSFDWSGSTNLKHAEVLYPAPHRFADGGGTAVGYNDDVLFPVRLTPEREGEPITLKLAFDYGICKDICIPNGVTLGLALGANTGKGDAALIETYLARVPKPATPGILPEVKGVEAKFEAAPPELIVDAAFPPHATGSDLFIDAGNAFIPVPTALGPLADGRQRFAIAFASPAEIDAIKGKTLKLTLVSDQGSTEAEWKTDPARLGHKQ
jgi:DsbC/DsbD-like thiol-disulfide interchange protein